MKLEKWAHWAQITSSLAVVVTLVFLARGLHENTLALQREAALERAYAINSPFLTSSKLPEILTKIKAVDGPNPAEQAFMDRYGLSHEEAVVWGRHLGLIWSGLEADYLLNGESQALRSRIEMLLRFPDNQLLWEQGAPQVSDAGFQAYVERVRTGL